MSEFNKQCEYAYIFFKSELLLIFIFFGIGDTLSTIVALNCNAYEYNPLAQKILNNGGMSLFLSKILFVFILYIIWNNKIYNCELKKIAWKYTKTFLIFLGVVTTISNMCVVFTGYNIFQHIF